MSTTRVGHATPATTYAHVCNRNGYNTIAEQSTPGHANYNTRLGDGIDVLLGGGQRNYLPAAQPGQQAHRRRQSGDGLPGQGLYLRRYGHQLRALNPAATGKLLGLFSQSEMAYELDRVKPALAMTSPAWPR